MTTTARTTAATAVATSTGAARPSRPRLSALAVVGAALLATIVPTSAAYAQYPAKMPARTVDAAQSGWTLDADSATAVPTTVPCFGGRGTWNEGLAGPAPQCQLLP